MTMALTLAGLIGVIGLATGIRRHDLDSGKKCRGHNHPSVRGLCGTALAATLLVRWHQFEHAVLLVAIIGCGLLLAATLSIMMARCRYRRRRQEALTK